VDSTGHLYVADAQTIRKITPAGEVSTLAGAAYVVGSADGTGAAVQFNGPLGVAVDSAGNFAVADQHNDTIREVTPAGVVTTLAGTADVFGTNDGTGTGAGFGSPTGMTVDGAGNLYVADAGNFNVRKITPAAVVTTLAGMAHRDGNADGTGADARFGGPAGVAVDRAGNVFVADQPNHTIRLITPAGVVTTLAGTAAISGSADGHGHDAQFNTPAGVAVDSVDNVYVADQLNHTIRKMAPGGFVTTLAGSAGTPGTVDGIGHAALFNKPSGVAVDGAGNVYVADSMNSAIRKITPTGVTTTIGGVPGVSGILLGAAPRFASPNALTIVGDALVVIDTNAILLLRHVVR
jgi:sugar lactone lactonase YvrE